MGINVKKKGEVIMGLVRPCGVAYRVLGKGKTGDLLEVRKKFTFEEMPLLLRRLKGRSP